MIVVCSSCEDQIESDIRPTLSIWARKDAYGIYTGLYCDTCYNSNKYPYRKDEYYDPSFAGESLEEEEY
jgi:hypothetical protein